VAYTTAEDVLRSAADCLQFRDTEHAHDCRRHIHQTVRDAALRFAQERRWEEVFRLLAAVKLDAESTPELFTLYNALRGYERDRIVRVRRRLLLVLLAVLAYVFGIAPSVFVTLENPHRIAAGTGALDWSEGLYWSVITSTTVGYGDIVPYTPYGRMFALFDALLGVLLMSVVAGLILSALTPRRFD
jgi:voltage-gated potassium channel Kch